MIIQNANQDNHVHNSMISRTVSHFWPEYYFYTKIYMPRLSLKVKCLFPLIYYMTVHRMTLSPQLLGITWVLCPASQCHLESPSCQPRQTQMRQYLPSHSCSLLVTREARCQFVPPASSQRLQSPPLFQKPITIGKALQKYKTNEHSHLYVALYYCFSFVIVINRKVFYIFYNRILEIKTILGNPK